MLGYILGGAVATALTGVVAHAAGKAKAKTRFDAIRAWVQQGGGGIKPQVLLDQGQAFLHGAGGSVVGIGSGAGQNVHGVVPSIVPIVGGKPFSVSGDGVTVGDYHASLTELGADALTGGAVSATGYALSHPQDIIDIFS